MSEYMTAEINLVRWAKMMANRTKSMDG